MVDATQKPRLSRPVSHDGCNIDGSHATDFSAPDSNISSNSSHKLCHLAPLMIDDVASPPELRVVVHYFIHLTAF